MAPPSSPVAPRSTRTIRAGSATSATHSAALSRHDEAIARLPRLRRPQRLGRRGRLGHVPGGRDVCCRLGHDAEAVEACAYVGMPKHAGTWPSCPGWQPMHPGMPTVRPKPCTGRGNRSPWGASQVKGLQCHASDFSIRPPSGKGHTMCSALPCGYWGMRQVRTKPIHCSRRC